MSYVMSTAHVWVTYPPWTPTYPESVSVLDQ